MMRLKSSIFALLLFASSSLLAVPCGFTGLYAPTSIFNSSTNFNEATKAPLTICQATTYVNYVIRVYTNTGWNGSSYNFSIKDTTYSPVSSCAVGWLPNADNVCALPVLTDYNGDRVACMEHGGWTLDGVCMTEANFKAGIKQNKTGYKVGTGLKIGGILMTAAGIIGLPFTFGASAGLIAAGVHSYVGGSLYLGLNNTPYYSDNAGAMSGAGTALSTGGKTYKLDLLNYEPSAVRRGVKIGS